MVLKTARIIFESFPITKSQQYDIIVQLLMEKISVMVTNWLPESILIRNLHLVMVLWIEIDMTDNCI